MNKLEKLYDLFRYDLPRFFCNIYRFRKSLWKFYWFDSVYALDMLKTSLEITEKNIRKYGTEVDESRLKKCDKMRRSIELLNHVINDDYLELAEERLGKNYILHGTKIVEEPVDETKKYYTVRMFADLTDEEEAQNHEISALSIEIEEQEWEELFKILKGQDYNKFRKKYQNKSIDKKDKAYERWFDGSNMKTWWS